MSAAYELASVPGIQLPVGADRVGPARPLVEAPRPPSDAPQHRAEPAPPVARMPFLPLAVVAGLLWLGGYLIGALLLPLAAAARWVFTAVALGWEDARDDWTPTSRSDL